MLSVCEKVCPHPMTTMGAHCTGLERCRQVGGTQTVGSLQPCPIQHSPLQGGFPGTGDPQPGSSAHGTPAGVGPLEKGWSACATPHPAPVPTSPYLGQVPEDQQVPLGGPLGHPLPLSSHILILLPQGWQQSRFGSDDRQVSDPGKDASYHHPHLLPTDSGRRWLRCWSRSVMRRNRGPWATMARRFLPTMSQCRGDWNCLSPVGTGRIGSCPLSRLSLPQEKLTKGLYC